ncbi:alpha/beta fold hydrolase [Caulobacter sp. UNC279MFTsu5.1]|uniref:alpha/beta fold hydrolase n=1 Tax=Caulobacter sp. UNC279MFTsu5.1 TaxID=1502775 RepID=UPI0008ED9871|nr:alpha/beta hydrolase [Caulobacter sp. UNC279MFTsu5.1]SFK00072.1 Pimeloyl-ACP methyl ester carboxylesterase [Caulobacter sp. UNC279MFTsu5.1]
MTQKAAALALALGLTSLTAAHAQTKPTVVLVHGAFADSSSWNGVVADLTRDGYPVVAAANPLRGLASDAAAVRTVLNAIPGPVILVGHSYGGAVISAASDGATNVKALVYVAAFAPDAGESIFELSGKFPGSTLSAALDKPVDLPGGVHDLYIQQDKFPAQFAADVPLSQAKLMAVTQRPLTDAAGAEKAVATAWKAIPSWWVYGEADRNIPPAAMKWMAERAHARQVVTVTGASHVVMISHSHEVSKLIEAAAR